jgi:RNA polymerase sigma factor (sigma-70 family)
MKEKNENKVQKAKIDPALVAKARTGDQSAFTELYEQTHTALYRSVRSMVHDEDLAWDILQDCYVKAFQSLDKLEADGAFLNWLRRIAVNETARQMSKRLPTTFTELAGDEEDEIQPELPDPDPEVQPELALDRKETSRLVREILAELPEQQQLIVGMRYYEDLSVKEISDLLNLAPSTVRAQLCFGRKKVETKVRALEKQGLKLYGLAPFPFLLALLRNLEPGEALGQKALSAVLTQAPAAAGSAATAGSAAFGAVDGEVVKLTAMTAGEAIRHGLAAKLAAGALTLCVIGGGIWAGSKALKRESPNVGDPQPSITDTELPTREPADVSTEPNQTEEPTKPVQSEVATEPVPADSNPASAQPYFIRIEDGDRTYFTDSQTEIWQEGAAIQKKDVSSGTVETLISAIDDEKKILEGVTANRLYFSEGKTEPVGIAHLVYAVSYENRNETVLAEYCSVSFQDGWTLLDNWGSLKAVDRNDQIVTQINRVFGWAVSDGCLYYVYSPALEDDEVYSSMSGTEGAHIQYEVRKIDQDDNASRIGSFDLPFVSGGFHIDVEAGEISSDYLVERLDLNTLQVKGYSDEPVPDLEPTDPKTLVSEATLIQGTYTDAGGNVYNYSYSIPRLNADTLDAAAINEEIDSKYGELARYVQSLEDGDDSLINPSVEYSVTVWQDVVTTVITTHCTWGFDGYDVYCYDCSTGRRLNTSALLRKMGITPDEFLEACAARFYEEFDSMNDYEHMEGISEEEREYSIGARDEYRAKVARLFAVNISVPAFPAEDGSITVVGSIVSMAGADYYDYIIDLGQLGKN